MSEAYPASARIRRRAEYRRIQGSKARVHAKHFILLLSSSETQRLGITVTKKVGNAVARNRVKRVLREVFRRNRDLFPEQTDVVVIAKKGAPRLGYEAVRSELIAVQDGLRRQRGRLPASAPAPATESLGEKSAKEQA